MSAETKKVFDFLCSTYNGISRFRRVFKSFKDCSYDNTNSRYVVESSVKAINFDKVTRKFYRSEGRFPRSADALTFSGNCIYFIEFKAGDQVAGRYNTQHLIEGVIDKINGSERTMYEKVFSNVPNLNANFVKLRFYLVVDAEAMGIDALVRTQAELSLGTTTEQDDSLRILLTQVLPDLKAGTQNPELYDDVNIWYSDVFDEYLDRYNIKDIEAFVL